MKAIGKNDKKEGKGIAYYHDGGIFIGDYENDMRNGQGIFYYNNGDREMGNYFQDQRIGQHVSLRFNGMVTFQFYYIYQQNI